MDSLFNFQSNYTVYILALEDDKYYVGITTNLNARIAAHKAGKGSEWTKKYPMINVLKSIPNCDKYDEVKYFIAAVEEYGIQNVRGSIFSQIELSINDIITIGKFVNGTNNNCYRCGESGHFARKCPDTLADELGSMSIKGKPHPRGTCFNCGGPHMATVCPIETCTICGEGGHWSNYCSS
jgi:GIY-YIG catalytic domain/Zinc knuckle